MGGFTGRGTVHVHVVCVVLYNVKVEIVVVGGGRCSGGGRSRSGGVGR